MSYLCNVFFIVLDLRLTKGWGKALPLFFCPFVYISHSVASASPIQSHAANKHLELTDKFFSI
jgi:hypothetical protein